MLKEVDNEAGWQAVLSTCRGKTVVLWVFPPGFQKELARQKLYELQKMQELYKGKNVVFLICIEQRQLNDKAAQLLAYLRLLQNNNALNNIVYMNTRISATELMREPVNGNCAIYNMAGQPHHPDYLEKGRGYGTSLTEELDAVLAGKGRYFEGMPDFLFAPRPGIKNYPVSPKNFSKTWAQYDSSGSFLTYSTRDPEQPHETTGDSVFNRIGFSADSVFVEDKLVLHRLPASQNNQPQFYTYRYSKEYKEGKELYSYLFDKNERLIRIYAHSKKLYRQYKVLMVDPVLLVLERIH